MILINSQLLKVARDQVQEKINQRISIFQTINPQINLIKLDRGDVVRPLFGCVVDAMTKALVEMTDEQTFEGRGPVEGYNFLREAILKHDFKRRKIKIDIEEIFINDGTKSELASIGDILFRDNRLAVLNPVYQTFVESNVIRSGAGVMGQNGEWSHIIYMDCSKESDFLPQMLTDRPDVIYLNYPNDPTGVVMSRSTLESWVRYANDNKVLILFDATYEAFITDSQVPHSIYEIKGAKRCAIEIRSFSKSAGFTGLHCGYTIIPKELEGYSFDDDKFVNLNSLWHRRQEVMNYTPSYITQRGAESLYTPEGIEAVRDNVDYYMENVTLLRNALSKTRLKFWGGENSPFIWVESPYGSSWKLFDKLLNECNILCSIGERFGPAGKGYVRLSAFADHTKVLIAASRIYDLDI